MNLNHNLISILALVGFAFLLGSTLVGGHWRRQLIKEEMKVIQLQQEHLIQQAEARYATAMEQDAKMLSQIDAARQVIAQIAEEAIAVKEKRDAVQAQLTSLATIIEIEKKEMELARNDYKLHVRTHMPVTVPANK